MTESNDINDAELRAAIAAEPLLAGYAAAEHDLFLQIVAALVEGQKRLNLTAIKQPLQMVRYHVADSVALDHAIKEFGEVKVKRAADVGTGGGFPLLPMAAVRSDVEWVGIESVGKKAEFVATTGHALGLSNISVLPLRAEDAGRGSERETFDLVTSRAVGPVASLLEVQIPMLKVGGMAYLFKTESTRAEWIACADLLATLGACPVGDYKYALEGDLQGRVIYIAKKTTETPTQFPRAAGVPFKKPLLKWSEDIPK